MAQRSVLIGYPGITVSETDEATGRIIPSWMISQFFDASQLGEGQRAGLQRVKEYRVRLDISWSIREQLLGDEPAQRCDPSTQDIVRELTTPKYATDDPFVAQLQLKLKREPTAKEIFIEKRRQARIDCISFGGYELADLPSDIVQMIAEGRIHVVVFDHERRIRKNARKEDLRYRSLDLLELLHLYKEGQNKVPVAPLARYGRGGRRQLETQTFAMRTARIGSGSTEFGNIAYVEMPTAEKPGLILVLPSFVVWHLGSIAIGDLAWTQARFLYAVRAIDAFFDGKQADDEADAEQAEGKRAESAAPETSASSEESATEGASEVGASPSNDSVAN